MNLLKIAMAAVLALGGTAFAGAPEGFEKFYDAPTQVNMGGRPVIAEIALYADGNTESQGRLEIALVTDVTKFIEETERDLEHWIAMHRQDCGERWAAGKPLIGFPRGAIRFALELEYEYWSCGWNGQGDPWRVVGETGNIDVTIIPEVVEGKLQARLDDFSIDQRTGVNKYLPLEFVTRRILISELDKLNENPKFYRAPQPFHREGFTYRAIEADRENGRVVITARYVADGDEGMLERIVNDLLDTGIVSER